MANYKDNNVNIETLLEPGRNNYTGVLSSSNAAEGFNDNGNNIFIDKAFSYVDDKWHNHYDDVYIDGNKSSSRYYPLLKGYAPTYKERLYTLFDDSMASGDNITSNWHYLVSDSAGNLRISTSNSTSSGVRLGDRTIYNTKALYCVLVGGGGGGGTAYFDLGGYCSGGGGGGGGTAVCLIRIPELTNKVMYRFCAGCAGAPRTDDQNLPSYTGGQSTIQVPNLVNVPEITAYGGSGGYAKWGNEDDSSGKGGAIYQYRPESSDSFAMTVVSSVTGGDGGNAVWRSASAAEERASYGEDTRFSQTFRAQEYYGTSDLSFTCRGSKPSDTGGSHGGGGGAGSFFQLEDNVISIPLISDVDSGGTVVANGGPGNKGRTIGAGGGGGSRNSNGGIIKQTHPGGEGQCGLVMFFY